MGSFLFLKRNPIVDWIIKGEDCDPELNLASSPNVLMGIMGGAFISAQWENRVFSLS